MQNIDKFRVCLVEDISYIRLVVKEILEEEDYIVEDFANGQEAIEYLKSEKQLPDIIFLDLIMPVMSGWQFLKAFQEEAAWKDIPIVVFSVNSEELSNLYPAIAFYRKPTEISDFFHVIDLYCKKRS